MKRPTHHDVARLAGTSQTTVSLVLRGSQRALRISEQTRQAVLRAAGELGYVPDLSARRLRGAGSGAAPHLVLGLLRPAGSAIEASSHLVEALDACLVQLPGEPQLVLERYTPGELARHSGLASVSRFHGAVVTGLSPVDLTFLDATLDTGGPQVPLVAFQRRPAQRAYVDVDNVAGGAALARHVLDRGRRRIAVLTQTTPFSAAQQDRLAGVRRALDDAGRGGDMRLASVAGRDPAHASALTRELLVSPDGWRPDAVLCLVGPCTLGVLRGLHSAGRRVPDDVAVGSYEDLFYAPHVVPSLTSVRLPYQQMGDAAAGWLAEAARGRPCDPLRRVFEPALVVREST